MVEYTSVSSNFASMVHPSTGIYTTGSTSGSATSSPLLPMSYCTFCSKPGHVELACELYLTAQSAAREPAKKQCKKRRRKQTKTKVAASPIADMVKEFAGNSIITPSPGTNSELWNCDTGATSHMTPHRHTLVQNIHSICHSNISCQWADCLLCRYRLYTI